jgi:hypothetical protein
MLRLLYFKSRIKALKQLRAIVCFNTLSFSPAFPCHTIGTVAKYHTVGTVAKYHTIETVAKYHTVGTVAKYHTIGTVAKYHTVGTVAKYHTVGTEAPHINSYNVLRREVWSPYY